MKNLFKEIEKERDNGRTLIDMEGNFHSPKELADKMKKDFTKALLNAEIPTSLSLDTYIGERITSEYVHLDDITTPIKSALKKRIHKADFTPKEESNEEKGN